MLRHLGFILLSLQVTAVFISFAQAQTLSVLDMNDRQAWTALGVVKARGTKGASSCSGTLVAPDLIVTAAHCTTSKDGLLASLLFSAGQNGTRLIASSGSVEISRHPAWAYASGSTQYRFDLAVVRLSRPIYSDKVRAVPLVPPKTEWPKTGALMGYQSVPGNVLHGRFDCPLTSMVPLGLVASECRVISGNSGGAVLVNIDSKWQLAGVIVARREPEGTALAVAINDWLRRHVNDALKREEQRLASK